MFLKQSGQLFQSVVGFVGDFTFGLKQVFTLLSVWVFIFCKVMLMRIVAILILMSLASPVLALLSAPKPQGTGIVFVLHVPWQSGPKMIEAAGGRVIGP